VLVRLARAPSRWTPRATAHNISVPEERRQTMQETEKIWMNGELVDWADARIHVGAHGLHYGSGVFEGIRCYETPKGPAVFRLTDHLVRLHNSARLLHMDLPYSLEELHAASMEVIEANNLPACYLRPICFYGYGQLGVAARDNPIETVIMSWPWGAYLGEEGLRNGIRAKISSWQRIGPNVVPHVAKATGIYLNSMLAVTEALRAGYEEAILLNAEGYVADGSGENIFVVKDGTVFTPPLAMSILPGITRACVIEIAQDLGYTVEETNLIRSDLYLADEVFMCGTAAEVTPLRSIDDVEIGVGPVTLEIQKTYLSAAQGESERWEHWLEYASAPARARA
jgi:branched-chain amino acid aminotransferase